MNRHLLLFAAIFPIAYPAHAAASGSPAELAPYKRAELPIEQRIADLLGRMTLEEKVDQLHQISVGDTNPNNLSERAERFRPGIGSFIIGGKQPLLETRNALQNRAVRESRLGIPALFGADVIHGFRAITPIPLAQACTWDPTLVQRGCAETALVTRAQGIDWTFAPMVDHCVDARWGRIAETFGESPYAAGIFSAASVRGFQGERLDSAASIAACLKHYVGYGASEGGRDYSYSAIPAQTLWEMHLPSFEAGVRAGARSVMSAFNDISGVPASASRYVLTEVLRERWGFNGLVVSDWAAVQQLINQGFAANDADATQLAIMAGVDIDMADGLYLKQLAALVASGKVPLAVVDEAVRRVLRVKFELGLFEHPITDVSPLAGGEPTPDQLEITEELAARSIVLLKNTGVLPLSPTVHNIALIGPLASDGGALLGSWSQAGRAEETPTIQAELQKRLPSGVTLNAVPGCSVEGKVPENFDAALAAARASDLVILCLGENSRMSGENASRSTLRLAGRQEDLALAIAALGKPVVLVLVSGRPLEIASIEGTMDAIVAAWQGGSRAGAAIADTLLGRRSPSGRLAVTWPRTTGQIPIYHNMRPRARRGEQGAYRDIPTTPQYEFGHGLGYTTFETSPIRLSKESVAPGETITAEVTVTNSGSREGVETVFWFIRDPAASITRPIKDLKFFEQASIPAGGNRVFRFEIEPMRDLSFPDADGRRILEPGEIRLLVGTQSVPFNVVK